MEILKKTIKQVLTTGTTVDQRAGYFLIIPDTGVTYSMKILLTADVTDIGFLDPVDSVTGDTIYYDLIYGDYICTNKNIIDTIAYDDIIYGDYVCSMVDIQQSLLTINIKFLVPYTSTSGLNGFYYINQNKYNIIMYETDHINTLTLNNGIVTFDMSNLEYLVNDVIRPHYRRYNINNSSWIDNTDNSNTLNFNMSGDSTLNVELYCLSCDTLATFIFIPTTTSYVPTTTAYISTTTSYVPTTTAYIPTTSYVPTTTAYIPTTSYVPTTTSYVPTTTAYGFTTTEYVSTTTVYVPTTTVFVPTTTSYVPTTTVYGFTTTAYVATTTIFVPTTTSYVATTTAYVATTTIFVPTTTSYVPTTTEYIPTTTSYVPTTTSYVPTTTNNSFTPVDGDGPNASFETISCFVPTAYTFYTDANFIINVGDHIYTTNGTGSPIAQGWYFIVDLNSVVRRYEIGLSTGEVITIIEGGCVPTTTYVPTTSYVPTTEYVPTTTEYIATTTAYVATTTEYVATTTVADAGGSVTFNFYNNATTTTATIEPAKVNTISLWDFPSVNKGESKTVSWIIIGGDNTLTNTVYTTYLADGRLRIVKNGSTIDTYILNGNETHDSTISGNAGDVFDIYLEDI